MKCKKCGERFSAAHTQGAPGGTDAPGVLLTALAVAYGLSRRACSTVLIAQNSV